jgi:hypothetical protein
MDLDQGYRSEPEFVICFWLCFCHVPRPNPTHLFRQLMLGRRLLESLQSKYGSPLPGFAGMANLTFFPLMSGAAAVGMGCIMPSVDYYFTKFVEEKQLRNKTEDGEDEDSQSWDRAVWNMPMRYIGGVIGFAWAASVPDPLIVRGLTGV